jgi:transposase
MAYLFDVIATLDKQIEQCYRQNALCQRIGKIPGIGPVTASALIATIGKANNFSRMADNWLPGSDWFHVSTPVGVNKSCSG